MSQNEWERFNRKINYMNDVKFYLIIIEICLWRIR